MGPTDTQPPNRRRRRLRSVLVAIAVVAFLGFVAWGTILPRLVRRDVRRRLQRNWGGPVEFGDTSLNWRGPIVIHDVALKDDAGRTWATTPTLIAEISHWQWLDPQITSLHAPETIVTYHVNASPPLRRPEETDEPAWPFLTGVTVEISRFTLLDNGRDMGQAGPAHLTALCRDDGSDIWDATFEGAPSETPMSLQIAVATDVHDGQELLAANIIGDLAGGELAATIRARTSTDGPIQVWGICRTRHAKMAAIPMVVPSDVGRGKLIDARGTFYLEDLVFSTLIARGAVFMKDLPAEGIPVLTEIASVVGPDAHLEETDLAMTFTLRGNMVTIQQGKIGGAVLAASIEPTSTANIVTGEKDMVTTAATLGGAGDIARHMPVVGVLTGVSDALTRATVTGTWREPVVTPVPMTTASEGLLDFFRRVGRSGGVMDEDLLEAMGAIMGSRPANAETVEWPDGCPPPPDRPAMPARPAR